jgi:hypothetical protein
MELRSHSSVSCHLVAIYGTPCQTNQTLLKFILDCILQFVFMTDAFTHNSFNDRVLFLLLCSSIPQQSPKHCRTVSLHVPGIYTPPPPPRPVQLALFLKIHSKFRLLHSKWASRLLVMFLVT